MKLSNNQLNKAKLKELIWYICKNYNYKLFETKLWKLAFFCEADYYQKYNSLITNISYIKNKYGPTPAHKISEKALDELVNDNFLIKTESGTFVVIKDLELKNLEDQQVDAINTTCDKYYRLTTSQICTLAHRDPVYLSAEKLNDKLDFNFVSYRDDEEPEKDEEIDKLPKTISFNKKIEDKLLEMALA